MNAYEEAYDLANELDIQSKHSGIMSIGATMLRQQADRISELEKNANTTQIANEKEFWQSYEKICCEEISSKPVAWLWVHKGTTMNALLRNPMCDEYGKKHFEPKGWSSIPLYTHPVKQLSDEEIDKVALSNVEGVGRLIYMIQGNVTGGDFKEAVRSFARAIIRASHG